jgi:uncharacterized protein YhaN
MRFRNFSFDAYGSFTDKEIVLGDEDVDFHIFVGPNEAGKSTILEGLGDLLFGIPDRSTQDYIHPYGSMRVGATLENSSNSLTFLRKKGKKNTLLDIDNEAIPDESLAQFLGGDRELFERMFGLSHESLREGGQHILEAKDDIGRTLFEASSGVASLGKELVRLEEEANNIFRPNASKSTLNKSLATRKASFDRANGAVHTVKVWNDFSSNLSEASEQNRSLSEKLQLLSAEVGRLERGKRAQPKLIRLDQILEELVELGEIPNLPEGFSVQWENAKTARISAIATANGVAENYENLVNERSCVEIDDTLLTLKDEIGVMDTLRSKAMSGEEDLQNRRAEHQEKIGEARALMAQLGFVGDVEAINRDELPTTQEASVLRGLSKLHGEIKTSIENQSGQKSKLESSLKSLDAEIGSLGALGDTTEFRRVVNSVKACGDLEQTYNEAHKQLQQSERLLSQALVGMKFPVEKTDELPTRVAPTDDQIKKSLEELNTIEQDLRLTRGRHKEADDAIQLAENDLMVQQSQGDVPSHQELSAARNIRNETLSQIRSESSDGNVIDAPLLNSLDEQIVKSDSTADHIITEASRVAELNASEREIAEKNKLMNIQNVSIGELEAEKSAWVENWLKLWAQDDWTPPEPTEANEWRSKHNSAMELLNQISVYEATLAEASQTIEQNKSVLLPLLNSSGISGASDWDRLPMLNEVERILGTMEAEITQLRSLEQRKVVLSGEIGETKAAIVALEEELTDNVANWGEAIASSTSLLSNTDIPDIDDILSLAGELGSALKDGESLKSRIESMTADILIFEEKVTSLQTNLGQGELEGTASQIAAKIEAAHDGAVSAKKKADDLDQRIEDAGIALEDSRQLKMTAENEVKRLCVESRVEDANDVSGVIENSRLKTELTASLSSIKEDLANEGLSLDDIRSEIETVDLDGLDVRVSGLKQEIVAVENERDVAMRAEGGAKEKLEDIRKSEGSADPEQQAQQDLDVVITDAERYLKLKTASRMLRWAIEKHREEKQAPLLKEASALFGKLTDENYKNLRVEVDDKDKAHLIGVKEDGSHVGVDAMSDGTRDQLYLAIRLAAIKEMAIKDPSKLFPFVGDDLLVNFDGARELAALNVLNEFSKTTQVLIFTHHEHLVRASLESLGEDNFMLHRL